MLTEPIRQAIVDDIARRWPQAIHVDMLRRCPLERAPAVIGAICVMWPEARAFSRWLISTTAPDFAAAVVRSAPQYPHARLTQLARLVLGESPVQLSDHQLTRREAHQWLAARPDDTEPAEWYLQHHNIAEISHCRTIAVARWIVRCSKDPHKWRSMLKLRRQGCYIYRVDELSDVDLCPGVHETFRRATRRLAASNRALQFAADAPLYEPPSWWSEIEGIRLLRTIDDLRAEGHAMKHCVADYAPIAAIGSTVLLSVEADGQRSTAELRMSSGEVVQHLGWRNQPPPKACIKRLEEATRTWAKAQRFSQHASRGIIIDDPYHPDRGPQGA